LTIRDRCNQELQEVIHLRLALRTRWWLGRLNTMHETKTDVSAFNVPVGLLHESRLGSPFRLLASASATNPRAALGAAPMFPAPAGDTLPRTPQVLPDDAEAVLTRANGVTVPLVVDGGGGTSVEVIVGGKPLGPMVLLGVRCISNGGHHDVAELVFRPATAGVADA